MPSPVIKGGNINKATPNTKKNLEKVTNNKVSTALK